MKSDFKFSNLCGTVYRRGNLLFTPDGDSVVSPVGNRVSLFDLVNNKSFTFPFQNRRNIARIALSPNGALLFSVDEDGQAFIVNVPRRVTLHRFSFKEPVADVSFSPNGVFVAAAVGKKVEIWRSPGTHREFAPMVLHRRLAGHYDGVVSVHWSPDSRFILTTSKDLTARLWSTDPIEGFVPVTLTGHRDVLRGAFFSTDQSTIYTISKDGSLFIWKEERKPLHVDKEEDVEKGTGLTKRRKRRQDYCNWKISEKHYFLQNHAKVTCCVFHRESNLLVAGFDSGVFGLWEMPSFTNIHTLRIESVAINKTGEWLAFGSSKLGQLLVWEWQSETYVLKQQGHFYDMNCLAYSADAQRIVTGGDDGKVKVWNSTSGFCFVTFNEHKSSITAVEFTKGSQVILSSSLDGTVRAFDLGRYRNFRTFTSPSPVQFSSLAVDTSGEIVCAGSLDTFEIFVWSVQTGRLLDVLSGHIGPVPALSFSPLGNLASASWDGTMRVWDVYGRTRATESFDLKSDALAIAFRPDGNEIAVSTLDGNLSFWNPAGGSQTGLIEARRDIAGSRRSNERVAIENSTAGRAFTTLCYTADGLRILAGGRGRHVCLYDVASRALLRRFEISRNLSFDGTQDYLNSRLMTEAGPIDLIDDTGDLSDLEDRLDLSMPGSQAHGDLSVRRTRPEARTKCVRFSPTGRAWAAATTEGLLLYSVDDRMAFDPFDLDVDVTPQAVEEAVGNREWLRALVTAFRLGEPTTLRDAYDAIPPADVPLVARSLSARYLERTLAFLASYADESPDIEKHLIWATEILREHAAEIARRPGELGPALRALQKAIAGQKESLARMFVFRFRCAFSELSAPARPKLMRLPAFLFCRCDDNTYTLRYLINLCQRRQETGPDTDAPVDGGDEPIATDLWNR
ncbi:MAG: putative WD repeat protein [Olpidium bornovanus]|uniref:WD repeat protein n=1 Tax=Olpidium bornovanus TaxID=278681 RepID=A0A8H7ZQ07_9FUNG|nr:MAG: putative WD repeat protein [Olpidium bornovanus]